MSYKETYKKYKKIYQPAEDILRRAMVDKRFLPKNRRYNRMRFYVVKARPLRWTVKEELTKLGFRLYGELLRFGNWLFFGKWL